jgi:hypothetical protein
MKFAKLQMISWKSLQWDAQAGNDGVHTQEIVSTGLGFRCRLLSIRRVLIELAICHLGNLIEQIQFKKYDMINLVLIRIIV